MKSLKEISLVFFLMITTASFGLAQGFMSIPYYGKNKVLYSKFNWKTYSTEHFQIYFYVENEQLLKGLVETAESAYKKISTELKYQIAEPVPLIYYTTYTDFEQTNLFEISEGVLGVSEPVLHRIGVHGDMPLDELQNLILHELSHIFEFDILWGSQGGALYAISQPPLWTFEGLSEYLTGEWSSWSTLIVRDAVLNDRIPEFTESGDLLARYPLPRDPAYDFGHAIYEFIEAKFGKNGVREFWQSLKGSPLIGKRDPLKKSFNLKTRDFGFEFKKYLRNRFKDYYLRENPEDYSVPLGPEFPMNPYYLAISHAVSPSGDIVATITFNVRDYDIDIVLLSTKDGTVLKNITKGYTSKYEYIRYDIDPSLGKNLAWSPDGDRLAFFARDGEKYSLFIVAALEGTTLRKIKTLIDQPTCPSFYPDGQKLMFAGFDKGVHDIFALDLASEKITNLTNDDAFEKAPAISPDGKLVAYSIRAGIYDKLFLSPLDDFKRKKQLTFGTGNTGCPQFSPDSKTILFSGDARGAFNMYSLNLDSGELRRYTDVRTGNFFPVSLPNDPKKIVFSSFNKGAFQLFKSELEGVIEQTLNFADLGPEETFEKFEPIVTLEIQKDKIQAHKGMGKLYVTSRPPVDAIVSTDGSFYGGSAVAFSDILGDRTFSVMAYQVQDFRSYFFTYLNQQHRFQYMFNAFQYSIYYYPDLYYYNPSDIMWQNLTYRDAIAVRKISGLNVAGYYPFSRYYRFEAGLGFYHYEEDNLDPSYLGMYSMGAYGYFINGNLLSASISLTGETTHFKQYGPAAGHTFRLSLSQAIPATPEFLRNTSIEADVRQYLYLGLDSLLAFRFQGFLCRGRNLFVSYYGGNNQVRSSYFYNIIATEGWFANAELRFPLANSVSTLIGNLGPFRGVLFFDITRSKLGDYPAKFYRYNPDQSSLFFAAYDEFDAIGSFGYGFEFFIWGLPIHIEFAKRLEWPSLSKPFNVSAYGSFLTKFWIGFDF